jgi:hypothetical protein
LSLSFVFLALLSILVLETETTSHQKGGVLLDWPVNDYEIRSRQKSQSLDLLFPGGTSVFPINSCPDGIRSLSIS